MRFLLMLATMPALASGGGGDAAEGADGEARYLELKPAFVTNYGDVSDGRMRFVRADVSLRVGTAEATTALQYHMPQVRAHVIGVLARQDEDGLTTAEGRARVREELLGSLRAVFEKEEGKPLVDEVLFTNLLVHR